VPASTIHHYRRSGLLPPPLREAANRFCYHERHLEALRLIRLLRERRGLPLKRIAEVLPDLMAHPAEDSLAAAWAGEPADTRHRLVAAAIDAFQTHSYGEVSVGDLALAAGVAKGSVYRHFESKEQLFEAAIETVLSDTAELFAAAVEDLGGPAGVAKDPDKAATVFAHLVAHALPILLEVGARAAKGHDPSEQLARKALRTLAEAAGRPLGGDPIQAGLALIERAFTTVLSWAVGPGWPPDEAPPPGR
jgi:AcrR family transcriptional regulator